MELRAALWRTSRVIANETRLRLLWAIFEEGELSVTEASFLLGISQPNTSLQLKALSDRGLIIARREKMWVIYRAEANEAVDFAPELLKALRICFEKSVSFKTLIRHATAFTHERRIEIIRALRRQALDLQGLQDRTGMSLPALSRHLDKLERRGFVKCQGEIYRMRSTESVLGRSLLTLALR